MSLDNVCIKNEFLTVNIKTLGAELTSIKDSNGEERLHQPDMVFWNGQAPVLFPICGTPKDKKIIADGKEYEMGSHGFARHCEFNLMECNEDLAVFSLISNEETKKKYPFDFELIITYKLLGNSIDVSYEIINDGDDEMYFSIGSHESYNCLEGLGEYEIHFEKEEPIKPYIFENHRIPQENLTTVDGHSVLSLSDNLFEDAVTVVYEKPESDFVYLVNKTEDKKIRVEFEGFTNLFIWTQPGSQFVCIEPWCGMADGPDASLDIKEKVDIMTLESGGHYENHHIISIL